MARVRAPSRRPSATLRWLRGLLAPKSSGVVAVETLLERVLDTILRGDLQGACHLLESAPPHDRDRAAGLKALADAYADLGRAADAERHYRAALALEPGLAPAWNNLGLLLRATGHPEQAKAAFDRATAADPSLTAAALNLADSLEQSDDTAAALLLLQAAAQRDPGNPPIAVNLAALLLNTGDAAGAEAVLRPAMDMAPREPRVLFNLAIALRAQGMVREACELFERALEADPGNHSIASARLLTMQYRDDVDAIAIADAHFTFGARFAEAAVQTPPPLDGPLRVGFVSADFGYHVVAAFLEPLFAHLDPHKVHVYCYHAGTLDDAQTARLRALAHTWRMVASLDDSGCAECIRADRLHLCIDLSGHTGGNRLPVFALRVAPVQATWLGYPDGTGLAAMDARFTDAMADPPGEADTRHSEQLVRLPGFLCQPVRREAPPVAPLPAAASEFVTFGCFNHLAKLSDATLALWADVLRAVPRARLLVKARGLERPLAAQRLRERFHAAGGEFRNLVLEGATPDSASHLTRYGAVDVALDSIPYNGTTTTCEALWMGVPVITLAGNRHAARVGASILARAGHPEWVARTPAEFVTVATQLAADRPTLARVRAGLRASVAASPLADAAGFARDFEQACRALVSPC